MQKSLFLLLIFLQFTAGYTQTSIDFFEIDEVGSNYIKFLKEGNISGMENVKPPPNTWTFKKLALYKKALSEEESIFYGSFIMPSRNPEIFSYNLFAISKTKTSQYYFVAVVEVQTSNQTIQATQGYLFTEKKSLKAWWTKTANYYRSTEIKEFPKDVIHEMCPPPPF